MLSRLWYLVLALAVGAALAGAFLNKSAASRDAEFQLEEQLRRDRIEAELWMRLDARLRLDALASIAVEPEVRQTLRSSSGRLGTPAAATRRRLSQKLNVLNAKLEEGKGDMVFAVDTEGEVVATLDKNAAGSQRLDKMPLVRDALRGFMRDDVWVYNGEVFRMAARPVFDGGRYVGAVVHGMAVGDDLARRLGSKLPNASVVFFFRDRLIGAHMGGATAPSSAELKTGLSQALTSGEDASDSIVLGERTRAVASRVRGEAAHAKVGYMIGRKGSTVGLGGLFANTFKEDVASLPWLVVVGIPLLLLLLGLFLLYLEHDKAVDILRRTSDSLAKNQLSILPEGELRRHYRKIAENFNVALRAGVGFKEGVAERSSVDLDQILNTTRDSTDSGYFGFGEEAPTAKQVALDSDPEQEPATPSPHMTPIKATPGASSNTSQPEQAAVTARPKRAPSSWPARAIVSAPGGRHGSKRRDEPHAGAGRSADSAERDSRRLRRFRRPRGEYPGQARPAVVARGLGPGGPRRRDALQGSVRSVRRHAERMRRLGKRAHLRQVRTQTSCRPRAGHETPQFPFRALHRLCEGRASRAQSQPHQTVS
jgi:hypothetical protein